MPGPKFVEGESVGGTNFDPCFFAGLGWVCFGAADHPGTVTLDDGWGAFAGPGLTGSFEGGILQLLVTALVHNDDPADVTGAAPINAFYLRNLQCHLEVRLLRADRCDRSALLFHPTDCQ